jgi:exodeoxyribonuclease-3
VQKIASWNVNSLRVRLPQVLAWLAREGPDAIGLQETKVVDESFPVAEIEAAGYRALYSGEKTYNGVALLTREPCSEVLRDVPGLQDPARRVLAATLGDWRLVSLYVPNGQSVGSEKYAYKLDWLDKVAAWLEAELARHPQILVVGDFNVAPEDRDVYDPEAWRGQVLCSEPERKAFRRLLDLGLRDTFRLFEQPERQYTWWDFRTRSFSRNHGLRIDHILASPAAAARCRAARIDVEARRSERPSDHAPIVAEFVS